MDLEGWKSIAKELGCLDDSGQESSSSEKAREAIEFLLGKDFMKEAVRYYIDGGAGSELLRGVLWQLHPYSAMQECYRIFRDENSIQTKRDAIELLRVVADSRALKWVSEFLTHEDESIQVWGIGIVDQLVFSEMCETDDVSSILEVAKSHSNKHVREKTEYILSMLAASNERDILLQEYFDNKS